MTRASVCMAVYNGEKYLSQQIESILSQLQHDDELVIVDDCSIDGSCSIVDSFVDPRIRLIRNQQNRGVNHSFATAIERAQGDILILSDQDDVWIPGRLDIFLAAFKDPRIEVAASNHRLIDSKGDPLPGSRAMDLKRADSRMRLKNIVGILEGRMNYFGCAMGLRKSLSTALLPFPARLESHDLWIALLGNIGDAMIHLEDITLLHRIHGENSSMVKRNPLQKFITRIYMLHHIIIARHRIKKYNNTHIEKSRQLNF